MSQLVCVALEALYGGLLGGQVGLVTGGILGSAAVAFTLLGLLLRAVLGVFLEKIFLFCRQFLDATFGLGDAGLGPLHLISKLLLVFLPFFLEPLYLRLEVFLLGLFLGVQLGEGVVEQTGLFVEVKTTGFLGTNFVVEPFLLSDLGFFAGLGLGSSLFLATLLRTLHVGDLLVELPQLLLHFI